VDSTHQIANPFSRFDYLHRPGSLINGLSGTSGHITNIPAKIVGKQEIAVTEQHVGLYIEEAEGDGSMAEGIEG
jgi:hypothetical protein